MATPDKIVILDFGSQYTHLLARRVRQLHVYSEIKDPYVSIDELKDAKGIILSGGPASVYGKNAIPFNKKIFELGIPVQGHCYGHQVMAKELGGKVKAGKVKEYGIAELKIKKKEGIFSWLNEKETVWMSHGDTVEKLPKGFEIIASTDDCKIAAMANFEKKFFGIQFHPEVTHTENGMKMLENFVYKVCECKPEWTMGNFIHEKIEEIRKIVGEKNVFLLASGGIDSTVCLALLSKALGKERVYAFLVDNGFMRKNEIAAVKKTLKELDYAPLHVENAAKTFLKDLKNVSEPERKRGIIGKIFIEVANKKIRHLKLKPDEWLLGQGTIYPDTIESKCTRHADKIKTHHNRIESINELIEQGKIIEPISQLYKDEVRELGKELGLAEEIVHRHPFPGPGLAIRALCSGGKKLNKKELIEIAKAEKKADKISSEFGLAAKVLPVKSVGVQGDERSYRHPVVLIGKADWKTFEKISTRITNSIFAVNRVLWLLWPEKIEKIKLNKAFLTEKRLKLLKEADALTMGIVKKYNLEKEIWQFPTIIIPITINSKDTETIVLRPVYSKEAMTAKFAELDKKVVKELVEQLQKVSGVSAVLYDLTHKPPGTIEWE